MPLSGRQVDPFAFGDSTQELVDVKPLSGGGGGHPRCELCRELVGEIARLSGIDPLGERLESCAYRPLGLVTSDSRGAFDDRYELVVGEGSIGS